MGGRVSFLDQYSSEREIFISLGYSFFSLVLGGAAYAQDHPKVEITGYYLYFRFNPENSSTLSSHSLNGGGGEIGFYFSRMIGVKAEFAGYQGNKVTFTSGSVSASATANLFTYNVGPVVKLRAGHLEPFGEVLFGGARIGERANLHKKMYLDPRHQLLRLREKENCIFEDVFWIPTNDRSL